MKKIDEFLSQSKYAEHRNVTKGYIGRMVKEGRLHLIKGKLNVEISDAELDNKSNEKKAPNYWSEKALHEKAKQIFGGAIFTEELFNKHYPKRKVRNYGKKQRIWRRIRRIEDVARC